MPPFRAGILRNARLQVSPPASLLLFSWSPHLVDRGPAALVDVSPALLRRLGAVDRRLTGLELLALVGEGARLLEAPAELVGPRVAGADRRASPAAREPGAEKGQNAQKGH